MTTKQICYHCAHLSVRASARYAHRALSNADNLVSQQRHGASAAVRLSPHRCQRSWCLYFATDETDTMTHGRPYLGEGRIARRLHHIFDAVSVCPVRVVVVIVGSCWSDV